jgi:PAS domain S-box-containing protein
MLGYRRSAGCLDANLDDSVLLYHSFLDLQSQRLFLMEICIQTCLWMEKELRLPSGAVVERLFPACAAVRYEPTSCTSRHCTRSKVMAKKPDSSIKGIALRLQAEKLFRVTDRDVAAMPVKDIQRLVHELQVHQIELEMQNEELRRAEMELQAARDRYVDLYDFSPAGHLTLDTQGTIVEANLRAGTLLGINRKGLIGLSLARFVVLEDQDTFYRHCQAVAQTGTRQTCEVHVLRETGTFCMYLESLAVPGEPGRIIHWRTSLIDITERKRAEQKQHQLIANVTRSQQHFHALFNWTPSAVGISTLAEGRFCDVNEGFSRLTGYAREEVIGRTILELGLWADPLERLTVLREIQEKGYLHNWEGLFRIKSGEVRSLMVSVDSIQLGATPCLIYLGHDITERKWAEKALRLAKFSMDRAADAVYWIDSQAKILDVNEAASRMLGYSKEEFCTMSVHDLNPDFQAEMWPGFWTETKRQGTMVFETAHRAKDGRMISIEVSVNFLSHEEKEYHCAFVRDITERKRAGELLRENEERYRLLIEQAPVVSWTTDEKGRTSYISPNVMSVCGFSVEEIVTGGKALWFARVHTEDLETVRAAYASLFATQSFDMEYRIQHKNGRWMWLHDRAVTTFEKDGTRWAQGVFIDITERKRAEQEHKESEERYRSIFENAVHGIFQTTLDGKYVTVNPALVRMYGYDSPEDLIATITDIASQLYVDPECRDTFIRLMRAQEEVTGFEALVYRKDGNRIWISESVRTRRDSAGVLVGYEGTVENITERKLVEKRLQDTLDHVRMLSGRVATVQEEERTRIARELHDELGVGLTCLKIDLSRLYMVMNEGSGTGVSKRAEDRIQSMVGQVDTTIASVQRLVAELRPAILDDLGLVAAIEWQCQDFQKRTGIPCSCVTSSDDIEMERERATAIFRICQEALTNTARHARATAVAIKLEPRRDALQLVVADNGIGIPDTKVLDRQSLGLLGMRERVALFGGTITIQGQQDSGTTITACVPLCPS